MYLNIEENYQLFLTKLKENGISIDKLDEKYGELIKKASFSITADSGLAYEGSLVFVILYKLTPYAIKLNNLLPENVRANKESLIKVCLLHQLGKAVRIEPNPNDWEVKNRGMVFRYKNDMPAIRTGLHSLSMCIECGIDLNIEEVEAMTVNDRDMTDMQSRFHSSVMSCMVREASEMVYLEFNKKG